MANPSSIGKAWFEALVAGVKAKQIDKLRREWNLKHKDRSDGRLHIGGLCPRCVCLCECHRETTP